MEVVHARRCRREAGSCATIGQCGPQKHGTVSVTHSTGRSERSSWIAANSGCTSAHSSCSHSLHARRSPHSPASARQRMQRLRRRAARAAPDRARAARTGSSCPSAPGRSRSPAPRCARPRSRMPRRARAPAAGACAGSAAAPGASAAGRRRACVDASSARGELSKRVRQRGSPKSPTGLRRPSARPPRAAPAASSGTSRRAPRRRRPSAIALSRRTQSGRSVALGHRRDRLRGHRGTTRRPRPAPRAA